MFEVPDKSGSGKRHGFLADLLASLVVFLVALPLCLGIAIACGVPPALGLITGVVGGVVVSSLSGCRLQVSGPAAGLTVLVFDLVHRHGLAALGVVVLIAGLLQVAAGLLKVGRWFRAVSPAVIHGMLAGIGVLIVAGQVHVMLDFAPRASGLPNLLAIPGALVDAVSAGSGPAHRQAALVGGFTLLTLFAWKRFALDKKTRVPGALPAVAGAAAIAHAFGLPVAYVSLPDDILMAVSWPGAGWLDLIIQAPILLAALSMALIASAETLISAGAVDLMHRGPRTENNKELIAQGVGNVVAGFLGSLPITGVIARSSVNIEAGAQSRLSGVLHGLWLALTVAALPFVVNMLPVSSLAALLVFTGIKLVDPAVFRRLKQYSHFEAGIYLGTLVMVVATDLLTGVLVGLLLSLAKLVLNMAHLDVRLAKDTDGAGFTLKLSGYCTFLGIPRLSETLDAIPAGAKVRLDIDHLNRIDHACIDLIENWERRHVLTGGSLSADWGEIRRRLEVELKFDRGRPR